MPTVKGLLKQISLGLFDEANASEDEKTIYHAYKTHSENLDVVIIHDNNRFNYITDFYCKEFGDVFKWISENLDGKLNFEIAKAYYHITNSGKGLLIISDSNRGGFIFEGISC